MMTILEKYEVVSEFVYRIQLNESVADAYNYAKYLVKHGLDKADSSSLKQTLHKAGMDHSFMNNSMDKSLFDLLTDGEKKKLVDKAKTMKKLKQAGKIGAAIAIAAGIVATIVILVKRKKKKKEAEDDKRNP